MFEFSCMGVALKCVSNGRHFIPDPEGTCSWVSSEHLQKKMKSSGLKRVFPLEFRLWLGSPKSWWLEWGHRRTARTSFLMSWQIGEEWKSRGRRKDRFFKATNSLSGAKDWNSCQWYVPKGEQEKTGKARMSVGVEVGGLVCKTKLSVVLLFFCHLQERIKLFYSQGAGCLYAHSVFGEVPLLSSCAVDGV